MAQMTCLTCRLGLFFPSPSNPTLPISLQHEQNLNKQKKSVKREEKKEDIPLAQMTHLTRHLGLFSSLCPFFLCYFVARPKMQVKHQLVTKKNERNKKKTCTYCGSVVEVMFVTMCQVCCRLRQTPCQHYIYRIDYLKFTKPLGEAVFIAVSPAQRPWVQFLSVLFFYLLLINTQIEC